MLLLFVPFLYPAKKKLLFFIPIFASLTPFPFLCLSFLFLPLCLPSTETPLQPSTLSTTHNNDYCFSPFPLFLQQQQPHPKSHSQPQSRTPLRPQQLKPKPASSSAATTIVLSSGRLVKAAPERTTRPIAVRPQPQRRQPQQRGLSSPAASTPAQPQQQHDSTTPPGEEKHFGQNTATLLRLKKRTRTQRGSDRAKLEAAPTEAATSSPAPSTLATAPQRKRKLTQRCAEDDKARQKPRPRTNQNEERREGEEEADKLLWRQLEGIYLLTDEQAAALRRNAGLTYALQLSSTTTASSTIGRWQLIEETLKTSPKEQQQLFFNSPPSMEQAEAEAEAEHGSRNSTGRQTRKMIGGTFTFAKKEGEEDVHWLLLCKTEEAEKDLSTGEEIYHQTFAASPSSPSGPAAKEEEQWVPFQIRSKRVGLLVNAFGQDQLLLQRSL
ncbi:hypothetical protein QOT17_008637 [Balamuthia mandrillaris]